MKYEGKKLQTQNAITQIDSYLVLQFKEEMNNIMNFANLII